MRGWLARFLPLSTRPDLALLAALVVLAAGALTFEEVAEEVTEGEARAVDEALLLAFRVEGEPDNPLGGPEIEQAVKDLTALGGTLITTLVTLSAAGFLLADRRLRASFFLTVVVLGGVAITYALKFGFDRPRPDLVAPAMSAVTPAFPSGHSATAAIVYLTLAALVAESLPRIRLRVYVVAAALIVTIGVGVSRVYLGLHWPSDVLAGWILGATWALAAWLLARYFRSRGWIEPGRVLIERNGEDATMSPGP